MEHMAENGNPMWRQRAIKMSQPDNLFHVASVCILLPVPKPMKTHFFRGTAVSIAVMMANVMFGQFVVDTTTDGNDANPNDGICATIGGVCTFRAALQEAELSASPVTIELPDGTYEWSLGELFLDDGDITVSGSGARTTIVDAGQASRFFDLSSDLVSLTLDSMEFRNGFDANDPGGAIETNCDDLVMHSVVFRDCESGIGFGGGIHNRGELEAYGCVFVGCVAEGNNGNNGGGGGGGGMGAGGGISNWLGSVSLFENCTFSGCQAKGGNGGNGGVGGNGGAGGQSFSGFGSGGDGGDIGGGGADEDATTAGIGGGGGGGGFSTGFWGGGGPGDGTSGVLFGGNAGDGTAAGGAGGGGGAAMGGAFFSRSGTHTFRHCTFSENLALPGQAGASSNGNGSNDGLGRGGAIGTYSGNLTMDNCLLYNNGATGSPSGDIEDLFLNNSGPIASVSGSNLVGIMAGNAETEFEATSAGNQVGVDAVLLAFGDYGGPTDGYMISTCEPLSPAKDAGAMLGVLQDQRGMLRDANPDIGAIEGPESVDLDPLQTQVCPGETTALELTWPDATTTWPDGSVGPTWETGEITGVATILTAEGCEEEIDIEVTTINLQQVDLGADTTVCPGEPVDLDAGNPGGAFVWSTGNFNQNIQVLDSGLVEVLVTVQGCQSSGEVMVMWFDAYPMALEEEVVLCNGEEADLDGSVNGWAGLPPNFQWLDGPADAEYTVDEPGFYTLTATVNGCESTDMVQVVESPLVGVDLGPDLLVCPDSPVQLNSGYAQGISVWQDGSEGVTFDVSNTGIYSVNVTIGECQANGQVFVEVASPFDAELPAVVNFCEGDSVLLFAAFGASNYQWQNGAVGNQLWATLPGIYDVTVTQDGCDAVSSVSVVEQALPAFDLGLDLILCEGESVTLEPSVPGADYVIFNDSLSTEALEVTTEGEYTATVSLAGCIARDTIAVEFRSVPVFDLPEDTLLCPGDVLTIETGLEDVLVTWNTGEAAASIEVNQPGSFVATSQVSGCEFTDSMSVAISENIVLPLSATYALCLDDSLELNVLQGPGVYPASYQWEDGSFQPSRVFSRSGDHFVEVANVCDTVFQAFEIQQVVCGCQIYVPTAFTPNNDGKNDAWFPVLDCNPFSYNVVVWDRWGRPVFSSDDPSEVWYGQVEGTPGSKTRESGRYFAVDGAYTWEIIIELRKGRTPEVIRQNGVVQILR